MQLIEQGRMWKEREEALMEDRKVKAQELHALAKRHEAQVIEVRATRALTTTTFNDGFVHFRQVGRLEVEIFGESVTFGDSIFVFHITH